jgi:ABC-type enterochelin transport system permease subunit
MQQENVLYKTNYSYTKKLHCTSLSQTEFGFFSRVLLHAYYCIYILYYLQYIFFYGFAVPFTHMEQGNNVRTSLICTVEKCIIRDPYTITIINRQLPIVSRNAYFLIRSHSLDAPEK